MWGLFGTAHRLFLLLLSLSIKFIYLESWLFTFNYVLKWGYLVIFKISGIGYIILLAHDSYFMFETFFLFGFSSFLLGLEVLLVTFISWLGALSMQPWKINLLLFCNFVRSRLILLGQCLKSIWSKTYFWHHHKFIGLFL